MFLLSRDIDPRLFSTRFQATLYDIVCNRNKSFDCTEARGSLRCNWHLCDWGFVGLWRCEQVDSPWCCVWHLEVSGIAGRLMAVSLVWLLMLHALLIFLLFGWTGVNHFLLGRVVRRGTDKVYADDFTQIRFFYCFLLNEVHSIFLFQRLARQVKNCSAGRGEKSQQDMNISHGWTLNMHRHFMNYAQKFFFPSRRTSFNVFFVCVKCSTTC